MVVILTSILLMVVGIPGYSLPTTIFQGKYWSIFKTTFVSGNVLVYSSNHILFRKVLVYSSNHMFFRGL